VSCRDDLDEVTYRASRHLIPLCGKSAVITWVCKTMEDHWATLHFVDSQNGLLHSAAITARHPRNVHRGSKWSLIGAGSTGKRSLRVPVCLSVVHMYSGGKLNLKADIHHEHTGLNPVKSGLIDLIWLESLS
jgi:hypothetical protein